MQLRNANLAGVKLSPQERRAIILRYARFGGPEQALAAYGRRQGRLKAGIRLGPNTSRADINRARAFNELGTPDSSGGAAYAPGTTAHHLGQLSSDFQGQAPTGPKVPMVAANVKGGTAGGRPVVATTMSGVDTGLADKSASKRRQQLVRYVRGRGYGGGGGGYR